MMWSHLLIRWIDQQTLPRSELFKILIRRRGVFTNTMSTHSTTHIPTTASVYEYMIPDEHRQIYLVFYVSVLKKQHFS